MKTAQTETDSIRVERLAHLCKLWGVVKFFHLHPYLAYRDIDWDAALVAAIPKVNPAVTSEAYRTALQSMLGTLCDPATCLIPNSNASSSQDLKPPTCEFTEDGVLIVTIAHGRLMDYLSVWHTFIRLNKL